MPPMGGVTGAMRGTNRRGIGAKAARPKNMKHTVMRLFSYMKKDVWMLAAALLCVVAGTVSTLAASYMLRPIINDYIIPAKTSADLKKLAGALIVMLAVYLLGVMAAYLQNRIMLVLSQKALVRLRSDLFVHMEKLPLRFFDTHTKGDLMSRYTNDVDVIQHSCTVDIRNHYCNWYALHDDLYQHFTGADYAGYCAAHFKRRKISG